MNTIVIDCGASFIKGALIQDGKMLAKLEKRAPRVHSGVNPLEVRQIKELVLLVRQMVLELVGGISEVKLCISNEMHGFLLAFADGTPFTDYISWQKELGRVKGTKDGSPLEALAGVGAEADILRTGMPLRAGLPSCNLLYLSMAGIIERTDRELFFYTLGDYIMRILLDREPVCHPTNAAATGLYDLEKGDWNHTLTDIVCGTGNIRFPEIGTEAFFGRIGGIAVHALPALGDQQAALLGSGLYHENAVSFNLGTGAQVSCLTRGIEYSEVWQIRPYFGGYFLKTIPHLPCGRAMNVYIRFFQQFLQEFLPEANESQIWGKLLEMEEQMSEGDSLECDLSFFENAVTSNTMGSITNIGEYSFTPGNLMKAILTQVSRNFLWAADKICPNGVQVHEIIFSGGIARRIPAIRERIMAHFGEDGAMNVQTSEDETLWGLYKYGCSEEQTLKQN